MYLADPVAMAQIYVDLGLEAMEASIFATAINVAGPLNIIKSIAAPKLGTELPEEFLGILSLIRFDRTRQK